MLRFILSFLVVVVIATIIATYIYPEIKFFFRGIWKSLVSKYTKNKDDEGNV